MDGLDGWMVSCPPELVPKSYWAPRSITPSLPQNGHLAKLKIPHVAVGINNSRIYNLR